MAIAGTSSAKTIARPLFEIKSSQYRLPKQFIRHGMFYLRIQMPVNMTVVNPKVRNMQGGEKKLNETNQCIIHGPSLSVWKRMVTLSVEPPMLTTSRRTGFTKLYVELPALRITEKLC